jgi:hypothetical protein
MSRNSSTSTQQPKNSQTQAVRYSHAYIKPVQTAVKPIGYFNQSMVQIDPESKIAVAIACPELPINRPIDRPIELSLNWPIEQPEAVKYSYSSFPKAVRHSYQSNQSKSSGLNALSSPQTPLKPPNPPVKILQLVSSSLGSWREKIQDVRTNASQKDLQTIELILDRLTQAIQAVQPARTIVQESAHWLNQQMIGSAQHLAPTRLSVLHRIQALLQAISEKQCTDPVEADLNEFSTRSIRHLQGEKIALQRKLTQLMASNHALEKDVASYSFNLLAIATEKEVLAAELLDRDQVISKRDRTIASLNTQLSKYNRIRVLEGNYVGVPSSKGSKYHFHKKCPGWKMLVGEYMLNLDPTRAVVSSKDGSFFSKCGLQECRDCHNKG